ncbi:MAG: hypothetical protein EXS35_06925 [Pedosphaera sp.]|nr:hypothetical protein [Pedosphaera sp.]
MSKLIGAFIVIVVVFCGYQLFLYWDKVNHEEETQRKEAAKVLNPAYLPGMSNQLEPSYQRAQQQGNAAMRVWLKNYGPSLQDPRKAWIELDFCVAVTRESPAEAKQIFKGVKDRTPATSPIQPRLKQLEKSYE